MGVKLSPKEESNNSMKLDEKGLTENKGWVLLTSCSCFIILTTNLVIIDGKMVFWKLWVKLSPIMQ
jgi:hypothetical protein